MAGAKIKPLGTVLAEAERQALEHALRATGGNVAAAARHLGISATSAWTKIKAHEITPDIYKPAVRKLLDQRPVAGAIPDPFVPSPDTCVLVSMDPGITTFWTARGYWAFTYPIPDADDARPKRKRRRR
jgi:hypothetical protein